MNKHINTLVENEKNMAMKVVKIIGMVILGIAVSILLGFVIMWLWNWLMPSIFGLGSITYWQAVGIFILAKIIFGGISGSSDSNKESKSGIKKEIGDEIKKEIDKEFDKKYAKKHGEESEEAEETYDENNDYDNYDKIYEKWWDSKGEKDFNDYMKGKNDKD